MEVGLAFASTLQRTRESLRILLSAMGLSEVPTLAATELNERSYGSLEGMRKDEAVRRYGEEQVATWRRSFDAVPPGGESNAQASMRVVPYLRSRIVPSAIDTNVLVCAHGNVFRTMVRELRGMDEETFRSLEITTGSIAVYGVGPGGKASFETERVMDGTSAGGSLL